MASVDAALKPDAGKSGKPKKNAGANAASAKPAPAESTPAKSVQVEAAAVKPASAVETSTLDLKYLSSIRSFALSLFVQVQSLYESAKESSGVLRPRLESFESTILMVVGPVYSTIVGKPNELLKYIDSKIDQAVVFLHDNPLLEQTKSHLKLPESVDQLVKSYQEKGALATASAVVDEYRPKAFAAGHYLWTSVLALPLVPQFLLAILPAVSRILNSYNKLLVQVQHSRIPLIRNTSAWAPPVNTEALEKIVRKDVDIALAK